MNFKNTISISKQNLYLFYYKKLYLYIFLILLIYGSLGLFTYFSILFILYIVALQDMTKNGEDFKIVENV